MLGLLVASSYVSNKTLLCLFRQARSRVLCELHARPRYIWRSERENSTEDRLGCHWHTPVGAVSSGARVGQRTTLYPEPDRLPFALKVSSQKHQPNILGPRDRYCRGCDQWARFSEEKHRPDLRRRSVGFWKEEHPWIFCFRYCIIILALSASLGYLLI